MIDLKTTTRVNLRLDEFCQLFGVSKRTLYNWRSAGKLTFLYIGHECRIPIDEARAIASGEKKIVTKHRILRQVEQPPATSA